MRNFVLPRPKLQNGKITAQPGGEKPPPAPPTVRILKFFSSHIFFMNIRQLQSKFGVATTNGGQMVNFDHPPLGINALCPVHIFCCSQEILDLEI